MNANTFLELEQEPPLDEALNRLKTVTFDSWIGIPNFYIKHGVHTLRHMGDNVLTICSICSCDILHQARALAMSYKSGPLSFAVYIDEDISHHTISAQTELHALFDGYFHNITTAYDLYIGLIYVNKSSPFWWELEFTEDTAMAWKIPVNALRNLAEYQVPTKWLMTVDIDFELYSSTIHDPIHLNSVLIRAHSYPSHTMFVVPVFAMNSTFIEEDRMDYNKLTRYDLIPLVPKQITPFYYGEIFQECTDYERWYRAYWDYPVDLMNCTAWYEPFFIIDARASRQYKWDSKFTGRALDKIQRVQYLRYHNFSIMVMRDLFMIHVNRPHLFQNETMLGEIYRTHINNRMIAQAPYCIDNGGEYKICRKEGPKGPKGKGRGRRRSRKEEVEENTQDDIVDVHNVRINTLEERKSDIAPLNFDNLGRHPFGFEKYQKVQRQEDGNDLNEVELSLAEKYKARNEVRKEKRTRNARLRKLRMMRLAALAAKNASRFTIKE
eukprot:445748_1